MNDVRAAAEIRFTSQSLERLCRALGVEAK